MVLLSNEQLSLLLEEIPEPPPAEGETLWGYKEMIASIINNDGDREALFAYLDENLGCISIEDFGLEHNLDERMKFFKPHVDYIAFFLGHEVLRKYFFVQLKTIFPSTEDGLIPELSGLGNVSLENLNHPVLLHHHEWLEEAHKIVQETDLTIFSLKVADFVCEKYIELQC